MYATSRGFITYLHEAFVEVLVHMQRRAQIRWLRGDISPDISLAFHPWKNRRHQAYEPP